MEFTLIKWNFDPKLVIYGCDDSSKNFLRRFGRNLITLDGTEVSNDWKYLLFGFEVEGQESFWQGSDQDQQLT